MVGVRGLHHITAIAGTAQENLAFYTAVLGLRLVKRSVNQDDPGTYHLFYADASGHPGTDLTFFPWTRLAPPRPGHGLATEVALAVLPGALAFWEGRLARHGVPVSRGETVFGEPVLRTVDPHGLRLALVEAPDAAGRVFDPWRGSGIAPEVQIRGLHAATVVVANPGTTAAFLVSALGLESVRQDEGWRRFAPSGGGSGTYVDVTAATAPTRGRWGVGSVHHIAWRVEDEAHALAVRARAEAAGAHPTPLIDRFWFRSVYFQEPGGVLLELATDGPGFAVDEDAAHLGETLVLPPWLEPYRNAIERGLPPLRYPATPVPA